MRGAISIARVRQVQPGVQVLGQTIGKLGREAQAVPRRDFAGKVLGAAACGRGVYVQLEPKFAGLVDVVGIDLDLVDHHGTGGQYRATGSGREHNARKPPRENPTPIWSSRYHRAPGPFYSGRFSAMLAHRPSPCCRAQAGPCAADEISPPARQTT